MEITPARSHCYFEIVSASAEKVLVKPYFFLMKKQPHRFTHAGLHQTHYGRLIFKCSRLLLPSVVYDQIEENYQMEENCQID